VLSCDTRDLDGIVYVQNILLSVRVATGIFLEYNRLRPERNLGVEKKKKKKHEFISRTLSLSFSSTKMNVKVPVSSTAI
jgi:hypothetical protein